MIRKTVGGVSNWGFDGCAAGALLAALAVVGCSSGPPKESVGSVEQALSPVTARTLGFESLSDWSPLYSSPTLSLSPLHTEGASSLELKGGGWMQVESRALARESNAPSVVGYEIRIPTTPLNPWWHGTTALFLDAPSVGIWNQYVGQVELTGFPLGQFKRVELAVPAKLKAKLVGNYQDLRLRLVVNASQNEPASYHVDRFTFGPAQPTCTPVSDGNPCTDDVCIDGSPQSVPRPTGTACDTNTTVCDGSGACSATAVCQIGPAPTVDDGNPCTTDACDPTSGVQHLPVAAGTSCESDAYACNGIARCNAAGACQPGQPPSLDDGNPCTADACEPASGVTHTPVANGAACSDGNACTTTDSCQSGACVAGAARVCAALDQCHDAGVCDPVTGACSAPEKPSGTACNDGNACTLTDTCQSGACLATTSKTCAALDQCHEAGVCSPQTGECSNPVKANGAACSDGNACTQSDSCVNGACSGSSLVVCTAPDACHDAGTCDTSTGVCSSTPKPNGAACDDGTVCNGREICSTGVCSASTALALDDNNPCTADACGAATGVSHTALAAGTSCSDTNACNGTETCNGAGQCSPGAAPTLDDQNPCTTDSCEPSQGVVHTPAAAGVACDDQSACNGHEACDGAGACAAGTPPALSDNNPCTTDSCDPIQGVQHTPWPAGSSCSDADACNGIEECSAAGVCIQGPPSAVDDGNACTEDDCDPATGPTHTPIPGCGGGNSTPGVPFETRASVLGRLVRANGDAVTSFTLGIFEDTLELPERDDVLVEVSSGGAFRARLSDFPESAPERTPPTKLLVKIEGSDFATIVRVAYVRPGDAADLGRVVVLDRDPKVTVIGPAGGTATDSKNLYVLEVPAGALSSPTPIVITPIAQRNQFPTPLPSTTLTTYGVELEPSGTEFAIPARLRIKNTLNLPTSLKIPFATVDPGTAEWEHTGFAVWDGTYFSAQVSHFSPKDANAARIGELVAIIDDGTDPHRSGDTKCVGSSVGVNNGGLKQGFDLPSYGASGNDYGVSFNFDGSLSGSVKLGTNAVGATLPAGGSAPLVISLAPPKVRFECAPSGGGAAAGCGGGGGPCTIGNVVLPPRVNRRLSLLGQDATATEDLPAGAEDTSVVNVTLPNGADGSPMRSGYIQASFARAALVSGGTCAATGMGFQVAAPAPAPTGGVVSGSAVRTTQEAGPLVEFPSYELAVHRRGSPYGSGWSVGQHRNLYRTPDRLSADIMHGSGERETFRPYPVPDTIQTFANRNGAAAVDPTTGELFIARSLDGAGVSLVNPNTKAITLVAPATFNGSDPRDLKVTYVDGERRFLVVTPNVIWELRAGGPARAIVTFTSSRPANVAGIGHFAYFTQGTLPTGNGIDARVIHRVDLNDPTLAIVDITPFATGDLRFDPRGTAVAKDFLFLHPRGLAAAPDGGLYVADDRRNAVYKLGLDPLGQVGPDSPVTRVLGSGDDTALGGIGRGMPALSFPMRAPAFIATAPDGSLYVVSSETTLGAIVVYDAVEKTARLTATDSNARKKSLNFSFQAGSVGALSGSRFVMVSSGTVVAVSTPLSSQFDPTRTMAFSETGAEVVDTSADVIETYSWLNPAKTEGRLVAQRWRSGEPIFSVSYKDTDRIDFVQDPAGGRTAFEYDSRGKLTTVRDAAGRTTSVVIDDDGNLREVTFPNGEARRYDYDDYRMVLATQPNGESSSYTYAADGTLQSATKPGGATTQIRSALSQGAKYGASGRTYYEVSLTDPRGVTHTYELNPDGVTLKDTYAADGVNYVVENVLAADLQGGSFGSNTGNRLQRISHTLVNGVLVGPVALFDTYGRAFGAEKEFYPNNTRFFVDTFGLNGRVTQRQHAGTPLKSRYSYDAAGHLIEQFDQADGQPPTGRRSLLGGFRSADGQPTSLTQHGVTTTLGYDDRGQLTSTVNTLGMTSALHYDAAGNPLLTDDGTTTTSYTYDNGNRLTSVTDADGNATLLGYQDAGCACSKASQLTSLITPDLETGQKWSFAYDAASRPTLTTNPLGETELLTWTPQGDLTAVRDRKGRSTTFTYDQLGRVTTTADTASRAGVFAYSRPTSGGWSGPTLYVQSPNGTPGPTSLTAALADGQYQVGVNGLRVGANPDRVDLYRDATFKLGLWLRHDAANRLVYRSDRSAVPFESTEPGPFGSQQLPFLEENRFFGVSPVLRGIETYDKYGVNRYYDMAFERNADFDVVRLDSFIGASTVFTQTLPRDVGGRITGSAVTAAFTAPPATSITYKPNGQVETINGRAGRQTFTYDARGLVSQRTLTTTKASGGSVNVGTFGYQYDELGRSTQLDYPDGHTRRQTFDALGRLTSRCYAYTDGTPERCYTATYDATGNPKTLTDPEMRLEVSYDALDRVTEVQRFVPPSSTTPAHVETYAYNALGSFSVYDGQSVADQRPRLDGNGTASAGIPATLGGVSVPLDGGGRVSTLQGSNLKYFGIQHLLQAMVQGNLERRFSYDGLFRNGGEGTWQDQTRRTSRAYLYDGAENNIAAFYASTYDAPNNREVFNGIQQALIYDGLDHPLWLIDKPLNLTYYFELDTLGNVRRLHAGQDLSSNPDGTYHGDLGGYAYTAFGKALTANDPGGSAEPTLRGVSSFQPFRWQGRLLIAPNLYDFRARIFSTELGAFLQPDEYGLISRGGTLWSWPGQNPFRWRDPSGRIGFDGQSTDRAIGAGQDWGDPAFQRGMNQGFAAGALLGALGVEAAAGGISLGISGLLTRLSASPAALLRWLGLAGAASTQLVKGCADAEVGLPAARGGLRPMVRSLGAAGDDILLKKAVNSNLPHAVERGVERGVFGSADEGATALRSLTDQINKVGTFPSGTLVDTANAGRFLVPTGNNGLAVYQLANNGTAKLKTVLIAR